MIYYATPFDLDKNLGKSYNHYVDKLVQHDDDWIFFIDGDVMMLDPNWGNEIKKYVDALPNAGVLTCLTNRVGDSLQRLRGEMSNDPNICNHYQISQMLKSKGVSFSEINRVISGHFFGFKKKTWKDVGGFNEEKMILGVDNDFSRKVLCSGKKIYLMESVYVFHYYRFHTQDPRKSKFHLK